jgi:superfamily II DNA or RNA helicase
MPGPERKRSRTAVTTGSKTISRRAGGRKKKRKQPKLSRLHKPEGMSLEDWQIELRRQFGREQRFALKNLGDEPVFSEFEVINPASRNAYRVLVRGDQPFDNYCSCPDFATNTLGTCKHIEFALAYLKRRRGASSAFRTGFRPRYSEVYLHYGVQREVRFRPGSDCSAEMARLAARYFDAEGVLTTKAYAMFDTFLEQALELEPELRVADDAVGFVAEVRDAEDRMRRVGEAFPHGIRSSAFKDLVGVSLYDYQKEGALFAARAGRCLIGDEMGLGKTIQSIAAAEIMAQLFGVERVLIVCPTSLKHQWQREIERFVQRTAIVIGGLRKQREKCFAAESFFKIINYDTVHVDLDLIEQWQPDLVILDEAQRIKNWSTRVARSVKRITAPNVIVLTGTPLENRLEELISIVQFVDRHRLGPTFKLLHTHQVRDPFGKVVGYKDLDKIGRTLEPLLIRRKKDEVLDQLPGRIDTNIFVPMTEKQREYHRESMEVVARIVAKWRKFRFLSEADQRRLMIALEQMRMVCDNSYLIDHQSDHGPKAAEAVTLLEEILEQPGAKVVIFSQWLRMHELLLRRIKEHGWGHVLFQGSVPSHKRKDLIDRFRDDPECRLFLSTDAGGVGLNLQHASVVLNMDLPWNPAVLEQRIGRVHRLGQKQPVRVVNFVSQGAIEEGMLSVLKFKKSLFSGVLDGGAKDVFLGRKLDKFMEQVEAATGAIPETMIEDAEEAVTAPPDERAGPEPGRKRPARGSERETALEAEAAAVAEEPAPAPAVVDPWAGFFQAGLALLAQLGSNAGNGAAAPGTKDGAPAGGLAANLVQRDERTGETFLKLPVPSPEIVEQVLQGVAGLLERFRK